MSMQMLCDPSPTKCIVEYPGRAGCEEVAGGGAACAPWSQQAKSRILVRDPCSPSIAYFAEHLQGDTIAVPVCGFDGFRNAAQKLLIVTASQQHVSLQSNGPVNQSRIGCRPHRKTDANRDLLPQVSCESTASAAFD